VRSVSWDHIRRQKSESGAEVGMKSQYDLGPAQSSDGSGSEVKITLLK